MKKRSMMALAASALVAAVLPGMASAEPDATVLLECQVREASVPVPGEGPISEAVTQAIFKCQDQDGTPRGVSITIVDRED